VIAQAVQSMALCVPSLEAWVQLDGHPASIDGTVCSIRLMNLFYRLINLFGWIDDTVQFMALFD
jgi:predicted DNA-binding ribbon-helix-helix protein